MPALPAALKFFFRDSGLLGRHSLPSPENPSDWFRKSQPRHNCPRITGRNGVDDGNNHGRKGAHSKRKSEVQPAIPTNRSNRRAAAEAEGRNTGPGAPENCRLLRRSPLPACHSPKPASALSDNWNHRFLREWPQQRVRFCHNKSPACDTAPLPWRPGNLDLPHCPPGRPKWFLRPVRLKYSPYYRQWPGR